MEKDEKAVDAGTAEDRKQEEQYVLWIPHVHIDSTLIKLRQRTQRNVGTISILEMSRRRVKSTRMPGAGVFATIFGANRNLLTLSVTTSDVDPEDELDESGEKIEVDDEDERAQQGFNVSISKPSPITKPKPTGGAAK